MTDADIRRLFREKGEDAPAPHDGWLRIHQDTLDQAQYEALSVYVSGSPYGEYAPWHPEEGEDGSDIKPGEELPTIPNEWGFFLVKAAAEESF